MLRRHLSLANILTAIRYCQRGNLESTANTLTTLKPFQSHTPAQSETIRCRAVVTFQASRVRLRSKSKGRKSNGYLNHPQTMASRRCQEKEITMNARDNHDSFYGFYLGKRTTNPTDHAYDGRLIDTLIQTVAVQRVTVASTEETPAVSRYEADNCIHCHAAYGHKIYCPLINRQSAEAASSLLTPTEADRIFAHALGVQL
jgi:hypothetical protein